MQEKIVSKVDATDWLDQGDVFYRPQDKTQFFDALDVLTIEKRGLAVIANNEVMLNHYCRLMISRLRKKQLFNLEVLLPSTTDSLLKRFNKIIEKVSLDDALRPAKDDSPVTLMVVNDPHLIEQPQWVLLSQLISDFPGANMQLVVFINAQAWPENDHAINLFGHKVHRWTLSDLAINDVNQLFSIAESIGYTEEVDALVEGLHQDLFVEYRERAYLETAPNIPDQDHVLGPELEESRLEESASIKATSESNIEPDQSAARWPKIAAVSILMAASWIVTADIDFQPGENYINDLVTLFSSTKSINETSSGTKVLDKKLAVEVQQPPIIPVLSNPIVMTMPELENLDKNISVELVQQLANTKPRVAFASQKDTLIHANVAPEFLEPRQIVANAKSDSYFVQFNLFKEKLTAQTYRADNDGLEDSMLMPFQTTEDGTYAIISGPFLSKEKAIAFVSSPGMPKDYWIRSAKTLQSAIK